MAIFSKQLKLAAIFGAVAVYATDDDHDSFEGISDEPAADDGDMGMGGMPGGEGGMPDMEEMFKLDRSCGTVECPADQQLVQKAMSADNSKFTGYGCSSSDFMAQMMGKDKKEKSKAEDCCLARDIAMQTCGATKQEIEDDFEACLADKCGDDKDCPFQAKMGPVMEQMMGGEDGPCKGFTELQTAQCECAPSADAKSKFEAFVASFNEVHGTSHEATAADDKYWKAVQTMVLSSKNDDETHKAIEMGTKPDPFAGMGGMPGADGMDGEPGMDGEDDGSLEDTEEEVEDKEDKEEL